MKKKRRYRDFTSFIKKRFGFRVQKVSINAGFTCPNKDGTKGIGGCTYCNNNTFNPYLGKNNYIDDLNNQENFLRPQDSNVKTNTKLNKQ